MNIFSTIQWVSVLLFLYKAFCVGKTAARAGSKLDISLLSTDSSSKEYLKDLRGVVVFQVSFSNLIVIFQAYVLYEYFTASKNNTSHHFYE